MTAVFGPSVPCRPTSLGRGFGHGVQGRLFVLIMTVYRNKLTVRCNGNRMLYEVCAML